MVTLKQKIAVWWLICIAVISIIGIGLLVYDYWPASAWIFGGALVGIMTIWSLGQIP